jgi:hypothetical protein
MQNIDENMSNFRSTTNTSQPPSNSDKLSAEEYATESKIIRETLHSVSTFDGDVISVETFIHQVQTLFKTVDIDEEIFVRLLIVNKLKGRALEAFDNGEVVNSLENFVKTLRLTFRSFSYELLVNKRSLMCQSPSESLLTYTDRFKKLQRDIIVSILNNSKFTPEGKKAIIANEESLNVRQYIRGLDASIRDRIQLLRPSSIHDAFELAQQAIDDLDQNKRIDEIRSANEKDNPNNQQRPVRQSGHLNNRPQTRNQYFPRRNSSFVARSNNNASVPLPRPAENKRVPQNSRGSSQQSHFQRNHTLVSRCLTCNGSHNQSQCPVEQDIKHVNEEPEAPRVPPLEEVLYTAGTDDEIVVTLEFPSGKRSFIVDTGARINIVKSSAAEGCQLSNFPSYFTGIGGGIVRTDLKAHYGEHEFFVVQDDFPLKADGLIGRSFLRKERVKLDFGLSEVVHAVVNVTGEQQPSREDLLMQNTRLGHLEPATQSLIWNIVKEHDDIFCLPGDPLPATDLITHKIETVDEIPVQIKQYRQPPGNRDEILNQSATMLDQNIIVSSTSPYNSPLHVVPKKKDASGKEKKRVVADFRQLNLKTIQDNYPLPNIEDIFDQLGKARYFSAFDLYSGFHQIKLDPSTRHKTAFSTPRGHFEFVRMPFGLKNAPPTFQRMMDRALSGLIGNGVFVYLDDIIVYGKTLEEHNANLRKLFQRLREVGLKLQPDKCEYLAPELTYLGHVITPEGIKPNPFKIKAVASFPEPTCTKQIKQFLGLASYYRKFIKDFSKIARPLNQLLCKNKTFNFTAECRRAFETLRDKLCSAEVLMFPDFSKPFYLTTDASDFAIGAVLEQLDSNNQRRPIAYASRALNSAEQNYSTIEKELLSIVWHVKHFRPYLYGRKFIIRTDHQPLTWLFNLKDPSSRLMRWRIKLEEYDYTIEYVKGVLNATADALSRNPVLIVRWKNHISEVNSPSENAIPVYFSRKAETKFKEIRSPEDSSLVGMRISLEQLTIDSLREMLENIIQLLISEEKNLLYLEYDKLLREANLPEKSIHTLIKSVFNDPLINVELGTRPLQTAHTEDEKKNIIKDYHDSLQAGHQGITKTLKMILKRYYWRGIQKDVHDYIVNCPVCQISKHDRIDRTAPRTIVQTPEKRNEKIALDIVGPLPETENGNIYILTLQDCLTKLVQAYPLKDQKSESILKMLIKNYIPSFGIPKSILTDQGRNFVSELNTEFCEYFKIKHIKCTPFHPESNGSLERLHGNMKEFLKANSQNIRKWDETLPFFLIYYNSSEQTSTGYSPFELTFAQAPFQLTDLSDTHGKTYSNYLTEIQQRFDFVWNQAKLKDLNIKIKLTDKFNANKSPHSYAVGQQVLKKADESRQLGRGILNPFEGPFSITRVISDQNIEINCNGELEVVHVNRVRPFNSK